MGALAHMTTLELVLGSPAAGGGIAARDEGGRVIFVRHGLPGERVRATLTEEHPRWARADAIEILEASADRVEAPCPFAGPSRCGGCDYQHVSLPAQRRLKAELLNQQLARVAGLELAVEVEPAELEADGLGTRTRVRYGVDESGQLGMRVHRSHELVAVDSCPLGVSRLSELELSSTSWPAGADVEAVRLDGPGGPTVSVIEQRVSRSGRLRNGTTTSLVDGGALVEIQRTRVGDERFVVSPGVFWQIHRAAPTLLGAAVLDGLALRSGDKVLDLFCGAGLFTKLVARAVGPEGTVIGIESSGAAVSDAEANLEGLDWATIRQARVISREIHALAEGCSHAVIDPPRQGIDEGARTAIIETESLRRLVSVSCDPATFSRDLRSFLDRGWSLASLRAFDLFEMTEHLEIVAVLER